jgi:hypothetical protein
MEVSARRVVVKWLERFNVVSGFLYWLCRRVQAPARIPHGLGRRPASIVENWSDLPRELVRQDNYTV